MQLRPIPFGLLIFAILISLFLPAYGQNDLSRLFLPPDFQAKRISSSAADLNSNGDSRLIAPGKTLVLADLDGPGIISHIWATVGSSDPFWGRSLVLRIYWDGAPEPSVVAPFGDFFGVGHGALTSFNSAVVTRSSYGRAVNCYWKMPFRKHARITVTNESTVFPTESFYYQVDWQKWPELPKDILYFHARYRQAMPAGPGDYTILETTGKGQYVGTVYSVQEMETGWFGEGDDRFYIDGETTPSLRGTGTEDYFGDGWGLRQFSRPYYGASLWEGYFPGDRVTAYRWHIPDPVTFKKSIKVTIEHKGSVYTDTGQHLGQSIERPDWISSVAFWYQWPPRTFHTPIAPVEKRLAPYRILKASELGIQADPPRHLSKNKFSVDYSPMVPDAKLSFTFRIAEKGRYQVNALISYSVFGSRYQPFLDDQPAGPVLDLCVSGQAPIWTRFDLHDLEPGPHTLRFEGRGASPHKRTLVPPTYGIGVYDIILLRLEDMKGYHQALRRMLRK
ncbi:MAG: DUF2961 domain-containing protein [Calditrichaeota bacterium]|nr:DUF2961 domain-containing protein [Calditrichota bacterium]